MSQFRQNPISKHWVLIAPKRFKRPEEFIGTPASSFNLPEIDPACAFCPGNESINPEITRLPEKSKIKDWQIRVIPNKFEALSHVPISKNQEFYVNRSGSGDHEVIITRKHNEPLALQSLKTIESTLGMFKQRLLDLQMHKHLAYSQIFYNHGRDAGGSMIHPHYQIISTPVVPPSLRDEISGSYHHKRNTGECIYCQIMNEEKTQDERMVFENEEYVVFAPYASRFTFEVWILPKKHVALFEKSSKKQMEELAYVLKAVLSQYYEKLNNPPVNFYLHTLPFPQFQSIIYDETAYHWHITVFARLSIWAGFEYATGIPINPVSPEEAASFLKF